MQKLTQPVKFTDAAVAHIKKMLPAEVGTGGFRLAVKKTGCSGFAYLPAIVTQGQAADLHYVVKDDLAIFIAPDALAYFDELLVDYCVESTATMALPQKRLVFINPKETGRCGCGESFTVE